jgi:methylglutamate dehydrogenase subunit D
VADLIAKTPLDGMPALTIGTVTLEEIDLGTLTSIAPYSGQTEALGNVLKTAHGMDWPAPNRSTGKDGARAIWFGRELAMLAGLDPDPALSVHAALTDQSDAWTTVRISGAQVENVLARLVPLDLSAGMFKRGRTTRSLVQHMNGSITRIGTDSFMIMVFRSMAGTLLHDLRRAMESVAARG